MARWRTVFNVVLWILRTGFSVENLPPRYGPYQTVHRRVQNWVRSEDLTVEGGRVRDEVMLRELETESVAGGCSIFLTERGLANRSGVMNRGLVLIVLAMALVGCRRYVNSTPVQYLEGDHAANYRRVFGKEMAAGVEVVNSVVATYGFRPGVVTTDDFEFELVAPREWISGAEKRFYLKRRDMQGQVAKRRERAREWYAPKEIEAYEIYRDVTSVGYVHMLVEREAQADGRYRVFVSKH